MADRKKHLVVRISEAERAKVAALEEALDENASRLVRRWITVHYDAAVVEGKVRPRKR